jgi:hypothetical protein
MNLMDTGELRRLAAEKSPFCLSIYMPTHRFGEDTKQDIVRLKNLLNACQQTLQARGISKTKTHDLLSKPRSLFDNSRFWLTQDHGLCLFITPEFFRYYRLNCPFQQISFAGNHFHIKPLIQLSGLDDVFYILVADLSDVRLYKATSFNMRQVKLPNVPENLEKALQFDVGGGHIQMHSFAMEKSVIFHGHGNIADSTTRKTKIIEYLKQVSGSVENMLSSSKYPLVLAGVSNICAMYRNASSYPFICQDQISTSVQRICDNDLHQKAWDIVKPTLAKKIEVAVEEFQNFTKSRKVLREPRDIIPAAYWGHIDKLFINTNKNLWGTFCAETAKVDIHDKRMDCDIDLINAAAIYALRTGSKVLAAEQGLDEDFALAQLRFSPVVS